MTEYGYARATVKTLINANLINHLYVGMNKDVKIELKSGTIIYYYGEIARKVAKYILCKN